jgi:hypothetical protein
MIPKLIRLYNQFKDKFTDETWQLFFDFCLKLGTADDPNQYLRDAMLKSAEAEVIREKGKLRGQ